jgi:hypothetical protein
LVVLPAGRDTGHDRMEISEPLIDRRHRASVIDRRAPPDQ